MPKKRKTPDPATLNFNAGYALLQAHPIFEPLLLRANVNRSPGNRCPPDGWVLVTSAGTLHIHPTRRAEPEEWQYALAHALLHLGMDHFRQHETLREWNAACDVVIARFLADLRLGRAPGGFPHVGDLPAQNEEKLYRAFRAEGIPDALQGLGMAGPKAPDMADERHPWEDLRWRREIKWPELFGHGLAQAVTQAVRVAAGEESTLSGGKRTRSAATRAREWFISSYPLLGALATAFTLVEDPALCARLEITVAAVDAELQEIYINPAAGLNERENRFVMAHELLHVGLRHAARGQGRDPYLWNVACDYIINGWLVEMGLGNLPQVGALYDPELKGASAEGVYDRIVNDLRRYRKLATLRGMGLGDMLGKPDWGHTRDGLALDDFYRRCLGQGLSYHESTGRGLLPAGLLEEIRALSQPPIPWDVELAHWFDEHFPPLEKVRSYARPSRRQSATPDIPRPRWVSVEDAQRARTFGVVLDTSGSMERAILAKALGAISSYSIARDVPRVRVVFCDAVTYDQGYLAPETIAGTVQVRGRGGTILQPGIDLLEHAEDFPPDGPLLIITDGFCDRLVVRREHAYLLPKGRHLPFVPRGRVFAIE